MKIDMSPQAITTRLKQTSELTKLCQSLSIKNLKVKKGNTVNNTKGITDPTDRF